MKKWIQDLVLGIVLLVFSVVSFVYAYIMQDASAKYFLARADTYILLWTGILGILSVALIVRSLRKRPSEPGSEDRNKACAGNCGDHRAVYCTAGNTGLYRFFCADAS